VLGCVYRVVLVVAAAVLASVFDVTAISYCTFLLLFVVILYKDCSGTSHWQVSSSKPIALSGSGAINASLSAS
jgi:hypothetical protein